MWYDCIIIIIIIIIGARDRVVDWGTMLKARGSTPDEVIGFFNVPNPSSGNMAMVSTQPLTEMSTRSFLGVKGGRPARKADLTAICETTV
jgi:hypothetical protein